MCLHEKVGAEPLQTVLRGSNKGHEEAGRSPDSLNPNTAIQVAVEFNFGKPAELAGRHESPTLTWISRHGIENIRHPMTVPRLQP